MENNPDNISQIPEMQSPFDEIKQSDDKGIAFWNSRQLAYVMGYSDYRNFERGINKSITICEQNGNHYGEHFNTLTEMVQLGYGANRQVNTYRLSSLACLLISQNADKKTPFVRFAQTYFSENTTSYDIVSSLESSIFLYQPN